MSLFHFPEVVNERAARLVAAGVVTTIAVAFVTSSPWLIPVLASGFLLRLAWGPRYSPLARLAVQVALRLWPPRPTPGAPKRFAQGVGAAVTVAASVLLWLGHGGAAWSLVLIVLAFASLEASLGLCVGCWAFARLQVMGIVRAHDCPQCISGEAAKL